MIGGFIEMLAMRVAADAARSASAATFPYPKEIPQDRLQLLQKWCHYSFFCWINNVLFFYVVFSLFILINSV